MRRRAVRLAAVALAALVVSGHVGSDNVYFEGDAGPYPVRVTIRPPGVVPGLAEILVRVTGTGVERVTVRPVRWDVGIEGAPRPDVARPVEGAPGLYAAELWLMTGGSYSVHVAVEGAAGTGTAVVPVQSVARRTLEMDRALGAVLFALCAFLFFGAITLVGAAAREGTLEPGAAPDRARRRRARRAAAIATAVLVVALTGGKRWWDAVDEAYRENIYEPLHVTGTARVGEDGVRILSLAIDDERWSPRHFTPLVPDHGKLMHMFLVREPGLDAFAHVHPARVDSATFDLRLPPLPAGRYRLYADILHESGFTQTLTDTVAIPAPADGDVAAGIDPDDSWRVLGAEDVVPDGGARRVSRLGDGYTMVWEPGPEPIRPDRELTLRFAVLGPDGRPAPLAPYMGMMSHAAVSRDDGSVFVHLHPMGTISAAAQRRFAGATHADSMPTARLEPPPRPPLGPDPDRPDDPARSMRRASSPREPRLESGVVSFPYAFPRPGRYRIWVQVATEAGVKTGVFDATVSDDAGTG